MPVQGQISGKKVVSPVLGKISSQTRGFASAKANFRPNKGICYSPRVNFWPIKGFYQC